MLKISGPKKLSSIEQTSNQVPLKTASLASLKERFRELARAEPHLGLPQPDGRDEHLEQALFID